MREYRMLKREKVRFLLTGAVLYGIPIALVRRATGNEPFFMIFMAFTALYGASLLARPFLSRLRTDQDGINIRDGLRPPFIIRYMDILLASAAGSRVTLFFDEGARFSFEYYFEDKEGFFKRLIENGVNVERGVRSA